MTIILTLVGLVVFFISLFTKTFKVAFGRLVMFVITGFVIDVVLGLFIATMAYLQLA